MKTTDVERKKLLVRIESMLEIPMTILGLVWLVLLILELLNNSTQFLERLGLVIWVIFILDFVVKLILAPAKLQYLKTNVITIVSLIVPAFRVLRALRLLRLLRFSRGLRLVKILGSLNRGMRAVSNTMKRRAFGYVLMLTVIVIFAGAAGMFAFENRIPGGLNDFGTSLWWTTMIMTTLGSEYWPKTPEGRILCIFLSLFAFAVFGYITATIATFFIGRDADDRQGEIAGSKEIRELKAEITEMKAMLSAMAHQIRK
ncbi:MAG TPA: ion transporter [Chryseolinea sp.]